NSAQELVYIDKPGFASDNWKKLIVNHCAGIRRSIWETQPFDKKVFASEDKIWSLAILKKGYTVLYNVPCFYVYTKPFDPATKIKRTIIEEAAKEMITGKNGTDNKGSNSLFVFKNITSALRRIFSDLKMQKEIYKGVQEFKTKYNDYFTKK